MLRRVNLHSGGDRKKRVYSSKYALSSIVYCPKCGHIYRRIAWNNRGKCSFVWRCVTRVENGPERCDGPTVQEVEREGLKQRIAEMQDFLAQQMEQIEEYDESLVRRMVEKVTVYEKEFSVEFKSGTSVDVER